MAYNLYQQLLRIVNEKYFEKSLRNRFLLLLLINNQPKLKRMKLRTLKRQDVLEHYDTFISKFKKEPTAKEFIEWVRDREAFLEAFLKDFGDEYEIISVLGTVSGQLVDFCHCDEIIVSDFVDKKHCTRCDKPMDKL